MSEKDKFKQKITEKRVFEESSIALGLMLSLLAIVALLVTIKVFNLNFIDSLVGFFMVAITIIILYMILARPETIREIETPIIHEIEKPVIKEIVRQIEKPVIKSVVQEIEKPVIKEVEKEIVKRIYLEKPSKKLNIPRYKYRGSTSTLTYHKTSCRLSKSIKNKYKISKNDTSYFVAHGFKPCKVCEPDKD